MPALSLNQAFTARAISVIWDAYKASQGLAPYLGSGFFPSEKTSVMDLKWFLGSNGLPVSLAPSNLDALATLRDRIGFKQIETDMPFFREAYLVKEKDAQDYENLMNSADGTIAQQILKQIALGPLELIKGAAVVPERMIWQLLAPLDGSPKISISANGVDYDYNYDPDGSYKANHFMELAGTSKWTDLVNSDPFEDLKDAQKALKKKTGMLVSVATMNDNTFQNIVKNTKIRSYLLAQNTTATIRVTEQLVRDLFRTSDLKLEILVYDKLYVNESKTTSTFIPDGMVSLLPGKVSLGTTKYGKTPEERSGNQATGELSIVETGVAVYTFTSDHPLVTQSIVSEVVLPTYERMNDTYVIKAY